MPSSTDAMWTDSMFCVRPCAGKAMHCMQLFSYAIKDMYPTVKRHIQSYGGSCLCAHSQSADLAHGFVKGSSLRQRNVLSALVTHSLFHQRWHHLSRGIALRFPQPIMGSGHSCCNGFTPSICPLRIRDFISLKVKAHWCLLVTMSVQCYILKVFGTGKQLLLPENNLCTKNKPLDQWCQRQRSR